ncbi:hypothetical protein PLESTF_000814200 [Pleodorina starrii]|nr:hypothetical protein PLESTF_000814200 [Pleodorina starrii]
MLRRLQMEAVRRKLTHRQTNALRTVCSADATPATQPLQSPRSTVRIQFRGQEIEVARGAKLRTALLKSGLTPHSEGAVYINCRGIGSCGTCAVEIRGAVQPPAWTTAERLRLNFPPHAPPNNGRLRLACQVACMGDLQVVKYDKFWGEGDSPLPDLRSKPPAVAPLGALEFVLDPGAAAAGDGGNGEGGGGGGGSRDDGDSGHHVGKK